MFLGRGVPYPNFTILAVLFLLLLPLSNFGQAVEVSGTVSDEYGDPLVGATVMIQGTTTGVLTNDRGGFSIRAEKGSNLLISMVSFQPQVIVVGDATTLNILLKISTLEEVLVTGYTSERKADIIGSVSVVNTKDMLTTPAANLTAQLQGRASGVVVSGGGEPGGGAKVRIRGFTSFGQSDPLYVIDGVPTGDASKINPQDIESIQVLKDATSASIYGARAAQGVIIVTTKRGKSGPLQFSYDGYVGSQYIPESIMPDLLNTEEYLQYLKQNNAPDFQHPVFGTMSSASVPDFIVVSPGFKGGVSSGDPRANADLYSIKNYGSIYQIMETSPGTNWFKEITRSGLIHSHQLTASGGSDKSTYSVGVNYFNQEGTFIHSAYNRIAVRVNTQFTPTKYFRMGENLQVLNEDFLNGDNRGEGGAWAQSYRMVPYIPVNDINGGWGGNAVGESGNGTSPVAQLYRQKDNVRNNYKAFGNLFAELEPISGLVFRTSFGLDYGNFFSKGFTFQTYERSENVSLTQMNQTNNYTLFWTWTNTLTYSKQFGDHNLKLLAGTEAVKGTGDGISVNANTFDFEDPEFISLNTDQVITNVNSTAFRQTLASTFGRLDYTFKNRYLINGTIRRDGSSKFGIDNRYGVFPAFGVGWRLSEESFMSSLTFLNDLKIRGGWGQMGSERSVDPNNQYSIFYFNVGSTNYDIGRSQNSVAQGYAPQRVGSSVTKWETSETTNIGLDATMFNQRVDFSFNYFINNTIDLLVGRVRNGLEPLVIQPSVNIGKMQNKGFDINLTTRGELAQDLYYDVTLTFTRYKNNVVDIDGNPETFFSRNASRLNNVVRTQSGHPISSFYGFEIDGFFESEQEIQALSQTGAVVGSWKYKDQNADNVIDDDDRVFLGSPHPDFIMGMNIGLRYKAFDFSTFWVWNQGNELYNYTKYFTDMRVFVGGVSQRVLNEGWKPGADNSNATLPYLAPGSANGYTDYTRSTSNSYYIEDGSFLRARTIQLGYNMPQGMLDMLKLKGVRVYVQGQNLITVTKYSAPDPDINIQGDDLLMGVDQSGYPNARQVLVGLNLNF